MGRVYNFSAGPAVLPEEAAPGTGVLEECISLRHEDQRRIVTDPGTGLMGQADAFDTVGFGIIEPASVALGLRRKRRHAERTLYEGQGIARGEARHGFCSLLDVDKMDSAHGVGKPPFFIFTYYYTGWRWKIQDAETGYQQGKLTGNKI